MPMPKLCFDEVVRQKDGTWLPRAVVMAMDEKRRARDQEESGYEDVLERLEEMEPEQRTACMEAAADKFGHAWAGDCVQRAADRRRGARDDPPEFSGMPETGGGMTDPGDRYTSVTSNDRRRRAHDSRNDRDRDRFAEMFPNGGAHLLDEFGNRMVP
jgi:hypothetical protein